jgi:hypothetical protein
VTDPRNRRLPLGRDLFAAFEIGEGAAHAKVRANEEVLRLRPYDPEWTLPSQVEKNPLVWMAEVNGLPVDLRTMYEGSNRFAAQMTRRDGGEPI